ncbi:MAG TPA: hypothetical protein VE964_15755, partial [Myxococcales bacterium]|nr:hypothetical protein [Myxococcales bacterium]
DLGAPGALADLSVSVPGPAQRPLRLVFDPWKAWPKPAAFQFTGAPADVSASPKDNLAEVEKQVAARVGRIAFFGIRQEAWFAALDSVGSRILGNPVAAALAGGHLPRIFSTGRLDSPERGPVSILPQGAQRAGDVVSEGPERLTGLDAFTDGEDGTRSAVPHTIETQYWLASGGTEGGSRRSLLPLPPRLSKQNAYVQAWMCRGRYFGGSISPQEIDRGRRYRPPCR